MPATIDSRPRTDAAPTCHARFSLLAMWYLPALALVLLSSLASLPLAANAQVTRCTDAATGRVTYTDGPCNSGEAGREVQPRRSPQDLAQEREQAAQAQARLQQDIRQRQERELREQQLREQAAARSLPPSPATSAQCQQARQQLQQVLSNAGRGQYDEQQRLDIAQRQADLACLSPAELSQAWGQRAQPQPATPGPMIVLPQRPMPPLRPTPTPPREFSGCNVFRCYDKQGNIYPH
ncbi:DUF4124 domain-containing protein [Melaminivora sp.]